MLSADTGVSELRGVWGQDSVKAGASVLEDATDWLLSVWKSTDWIQLLLLEGTVIAGVEKHCQETLPGPGSRQEGTTLFYLPRPCIGRT